MSRCPSALFCGCEDADSALGLDLDDLVPQPGLQDVLHRLHAWSNGSPCGQFSQCLRRLPPPTAAMVLATAGALADARRMGALAVSATNSSLCER